MAGSIRPIMITYESELPYIPIRPTAVAAKDDMGVMVWVGAKSRAIPENYKALELNEALINWFSPMAHVQRGRQRRGRRSRGPGLRDRDGAAEHGATRA